MSAPRLELLLRRFPAEDPDPGVPDGLTVDGEGP